jgi:hypothetical protein
MICQMIGRGPPTTHLGGVYMLIYIRRRDGQGCSRIWSASEILSVGEEILCRTDELNEMLGAGGGCFFFGAKIIQKEKSI